MDARAICIATRRDGAPCSVPALADAPTCFAHDPRRAEDYAKGGHAKARNYRSIDGQPMPASLRPILRQLSGVFRKVVKGDIPPERARAAATVATAMARLVTVGTLEERMSALEQRAAQAPAAAEPLQRTG